MAQERNSGTRNAGRGIGRAVILAPVLAWIAAAILAAAYFNQRGLWKTASGDEAYRICFGASPPPELAIDSSEAYRHYRYTGELLAVECYVRGEGGFDTSSSEWRAARPVPDNAALDSLLTAEGLSRAPPWFRNASELGRARLLRSAGGRIFSLYPVGGKGILIVGGWRTHF
jgi:hypothetical protein